MPLQQTSDHPRMANKPGAQLVVVSPTTTTTKKRRRNRIIPSIISTLKRRIISPLARSTTNKKNSLLLHIQQHSPTTTIPKLPKTSWMIKVCHGNGVVGTIGDHPHSIKNSMMDGDGTAFGWRMKKDDDNNNNDDDDSTSHIETSSSSSSILSSSTTSSPRGRSAFVRAAMTEFYNKTKMLGSAPPTTAVDDVRAGAAEWVVVDGGTGDDTQQTSSTSSSGSTGNSTTKKNDGVSATLSSRQSAFIRAGMTELNNNNSNDSKNTNRKEATTTTTAVALDIAPDEYGSSSHELSADSMDSDSRSGVAATSSSVSSLTRTSGSTFVRAAMTELKFNNNINRKTDGKEAAAAAAIVDDEDVVDCGVCSQTQQRQHRQLQSKSFLPEDVDDDQHMIPLRNGKRRARSLSFGEIYETTKTNLFYESSIDDDDDDDEYNDNHEYNGNKTARKDGGCRSPQHHQHKRGSKGGGGGGGGGDSSRISAESNDDDAAETRTAGSPGILTSGTIGDDDAAQQQKLQLRQRRSRLERYRLPSIPPFWKHLQEQRLLSMIRQEERRRQNEERKQERLRARQEQRRLRLLQQHEENRQRRRRFLIPADHPLKILWDILTVIVSCINTYLTHVRIRERRYEKDPIIYMCECWFIVDMLLNFVTEYKTGDGIVLANCQAVWARYLTTWFVIDLLSLVPGELLFLQPALERQRKRGFFQKSFFRTKAVVRITRLLRGRHFKIFGRVARNTKRVGMGGAQRLLRLIIRYVPKYIFFLKHMGIVVVLRFFRQIHWVRKVWLNLIISTKSIRITVGRRVRRQQQLQHGLTAAAAGVDKKSSSDDNDTNSLTDGNLDEFFDQDDYLDDDDDDDDLDGVDDDNKINSSNCKRRPVKVELIYEDDWKMSDDDLVLLDRGREGRMMIKHNEDYNDDHHDNNDHHEHHHYHHHGHSRIMLGGNHVGGRDHHHCDDDYDDDDDDDGDPF